MSAQIPRHVADPSTRVGAVLYAPGNPFRGSKAGGAALLGYRALSDLAGKACWLGVTVLAARRLPTAVFGAFSIASVIGWLLGVVSDGGMQLHLARTVSGHPSAAGALLRVWLRRRSISAVLAACVLVSIARIRPGDASGWGVAAIGTSYLLNAVSEFVYHGFRGLGRSDLESTLTVAQRVFTFLFAAAALALTPRLDMLGLALLLPAVATTTIAVRIAKALTIDSCEAPAATVAEATRFRDVWPIGAGVGLSALYFRVDVLLVGTMLGAGAAALYNAVFRLVEASRLFPAAALAVAFPALVTARDHQPLLRVSWRLLAFGVAFSAAGWMTADVIVRWVYGAAYAPAAPVLRVLFLAFPLMSLNYALTHQLIGWYGQRAYAGICLAALVANLALNQALIPSAGTTGAAWATFWTEVVLTFGCGVALLARVPRRVHSPVPAVTT